MTDKENNNSNNKSYNTRNEHPLIEINTKLSVYSQKPIAKGNSDTKPKPSNNVFGKR